MQLPPTPLQQGRPKPSDGWYMPWPVTAVIEIATPTLSRILQARLMHYSIYIGAIMITDTYQKHTSKDTTGSWCTFRLLKNNSRQADARYSSQYCDHEDQKGGIRRLLCETEAYLDENLSGQACGVPGRRHECQWISFTIVLYLIWLVRNPCTLRFLNIWHRFDLILRKSRSIFCINHSIITTWIPCRAASTTSKPMQMSFLEVLMRNIRRLRCGSRWAALNNCLHRSQCHQRNKWPLQRRLAMYNLRKLQAILKADRCAHAAGDRCIHGVCPAHCRNTGKFNWMQLQKSFLVTVSLTMWLWRATLVLVRSSCTCSAWAPSPSTPSCRVSSAASASLCCQVTHLQGCCVLSGPQLWPSLESTCNGVFACA